MSNAAQKSFPTSSEQYFRYQPNDASLPVRFDQPCGQFTEAFKDFSKRSMFKQNRLATNQMAFPVKQNPVVEQSAFWDSPDSWVNVCSNDNVGFGVSYATTSSSNATFFQKESFNVANAPTTTSPGTVQKSIGLSTGGLCQIGTQFEENPIAPYGQAFGLTKQLEINTYKNTTNDLSKETENRELFDRDTGKKTSQTQMIEGVNYLGNDPEPTDIMETINGPSQVLDGTNHVLRESDHVLRDSKHVLRESNHVQVDSCHEAGDPYYTDRRGSDLSESSFASPASSKGSSASDSDSDNSSLIRAHSPEYLDSNLQGDVAGNTRDFGCYTKLSKPPQITPQKRLPNADKPFYCPWRNCGWKFRRSDELKRHYRRHTGEKPYACPLCGRAFSRSDHRASHMRKLHPNCLTPAN
ncbi:Krueppel-like factor 17 [Nematostella vectensis]|uniref:Krueppel-like factor 17 n=1 Tax=Nematostella vectensis TaxID=45351 RepID=UPI0020774BAA|nr:Krueppel-like factor 17 [Nematostella vectensis]